MHTFSYSSVLSCHASTNQLKLFRPVSRQEVTNRKSNHCQKTKLLRDTRQHSRLTKLGKSNSVSVEHNSLTGTNNSVSVVEHNSLTGTNNSVSVVEHNSLTGTNI